MRKVFLFLIVVGGLLAPHTVDAEVRALVWKTTRSHPTVRAVLQREKCDLDWEAKALRDSRIPASMRNNLPHGTQIRLEVPSCHLSAHADEEEATASLPPSAPRSPRRVGVSEARPAPGPAVPSGATVPEATTTSNPESRSQFDQIASLRAEVRRLKTELETSPFRKASLLLLVIVFLAGVAVGAFANSSLTAKREQGQISYARALTVERDGEKYPFVFVGAVEKGEMLVPTYRCMRCRSWEVSNFDKQDLYRHAGECPDGKVSIVRNEPAARV